MRPPGWLLVALAAAAADKNKALVATDQEKPLYLFGHIPKCGGVSFVADLVQKLHLTSCFGRKAVVAKGENWTHAMERGRCNFVNTEQWLGEHGGMVRHFPRPPRVAILGSDADERIDLVLSPPLPSDSVVVSTAMGFRAERPLTGRGSRGGAGGGGIALRSVFSPRADRGARSGAPSAGPPRALLRPLVAAASSLDDHAHSPFMMFTDESQPRSSAPTARSTGASRAARCIPVKK